RDITTYDARTERGAGVAFIPEDRRGTGLVLSFSIAENSILGRERSPTFSWNEFVLKLVAIKEWARRLVKEFDIRTPSIEVAARNLSGGNQQKVIVAREMGSKPKVLLAAQPTRGVDIGAIEFIHRRIVQERDEGTAVLLVSAELDEVRSLSDRIAVMYEGRIVSIEPPDTPRKRSPRPDRASLPSWSKRSPLVISSRSYRPLRRRSVSSTPSSSSVGSISIPLPQPRITSRSLVGMRPSVSSIAVSSMERVN